MSLKGNSSSAKLITEQLRSDHIGTLELLQKCTNENVKLKKELKLLKAGQTQGAPDSIVTKAVPDALDSLELVEINSKQADEIKLLKSRLSQAELQLLKFNQLQTSLHIDAAQNVTTKLKKREGEMELAVIALENLLRSANDELSGLRRSTADLQQQRDSLAEQLNELKNINTDVYTINGNLTATIGILHAQVSSLKNDLDDALREKKSTKAKKREGELELAVIALENQLRSANDELLSLRGSSTDLQQQRDGILQTEISSLKNDLDIALREKKSLEVSAEQKVNDSRKLLTLQLEQNAILKKELSVQVESAFQLQEINAKLATEKNSSDAACKNLQSNVAELSGVIQAQQKRINELQNASSEEPEESDTFKFTAPSVEPAKVAPEADGDAASRFHEFLQLKRENKELKIRLAEMETSRRFPVGDNKHAHALTNAAAPLNSSSHPHLAASPASHSPRIAVGSVKKPPAGSTAVSTKLRNTLK